MRRYSILFVVLMMAAFFLNAFTDPSEKILNDFRLPNANGKPVSLEDYPDAKGFIIVFTCNHCPFAKLYPERLNKLNAKYKPLHVPLIAISSTDTVLYEEDSFTEMINFSKEKNIRYPYLCDRMQSVAKNFGAQKTPHAFVIWKEGSEFKIKYNGTIDDNGAEPEKVTHKYVEDAVDALLAGNTVSVTSTKSIGCLIKLRN
jgi:peroxiredoxin